MATGEVPADLGTTIYESIYAAMRLVVLTLGTFLAWRNIRTGRANVPDALRLAVLYAGAVLIKWVLMAKHVASPNDEFALLTAMLGRTLLDTSVLGVAYLAVEPHVRRRWPWRIISWNRLLEGRWRDPLVARDVLIGAAVGVVGALLLQLRYLLPTRVGAASTPWQIWEVTLTSGPWGVLLEYLHYAVFFKLLDFFLLFLLLLALRRAWLAVSVWFLLRMLSAAFQAETDHLWLMAILTAVRLGLEVVVLLRFGLLAYVVIAFFLNLFTDYPFTTDLSVWYAGPGLVVMGVLAALAVFAFVRSLGSRPLLPARLFGDE